MEKKERINEIIKEIKNNKEIDKEKVKVEKKYFILNIDSILFAIQLEYLKEIFDLPNKKDIVSIPFTPQYIMGVINVRGEIMPVISFLKILGIEEKKGDYKKIAIIDEKFKIAFPFSEIVDLNTMDIKNLKTIKNATVKNKEQFLTQEFEYENNAVNIIDILKIYSSEYFL